ncbi:hypothetical protein [Pontitalea aquivivens]|uniref:hypothetical protein n=1 Tax=Pontitalea aquivivens TaxID=3388663 RepID=UPI003970F6D4
MQTDKEPFQVNDLERFFATTKAKWAAATSKSWTRVAGAICATPLGLENSETFY